MEHKEGNLPARSRETAKVGLGVSMEPAVGILGTGSELPEKVLTNFDLAKMVDTSDQWITERTGIKERRQAAPHETT